MKTKITTWLRELFGFTYVINLRSKEIHDTHNTKYGCMLNLIVKFEHITSRKMRKLLKSDKGYDGCTHCNKKNHTK